MGWLWGSSDPEQSQSTPSPPTKESQSYPGRAALPLTSKNTTIPTDTIPGDKKSDTEWLSSTSHDNFDERGPTSQPPRGADEQAEAEFQAFMKEAAKTAERSTPTGPDDYSIYDDPDPNAPKLITPDNLYPIRAACSTMWDTAWGCATPKGHFQNIYRYGTMRTCKTLWAETMWCMRMNRAVWMTPEERARRTQKKMWERERNRLVERGGSSEEVWSKRRYLVKNAFQSDWTEYLEEVDETGKDFTEPKPSS